MPAYLMLFLQAVTAAMGAAPQIAVVIHAAKDFISGLFASGLIDKAAQYRVHDHIDQIASAIRDGRTPPELLVEPDPQSLEGMKEES